MNDQEHNRRFDDQANWFVKAGALTRSIRFVLSIFALLLAASLLFQFTAARSDASRAAEELAQLESQASSLESLALSNRRTLEAILDCTTTQGECFKDGQQRTAEVVAGLNIVTQYSVICGEREEGEQEILSCVNEEVEAYLASLEKKEGKNG